MLIHMAGVLSIQKYVGFLWVKPYSDYVQYVVVSPLPCLFQSQVFLEKEFFLIRNLEQQMGIKVVLKPFREYPWDHVPQMHGPAWSPSCVKIEFIVFPVIF